MTDKMTSKTSAKTTAPQRTAKRSAPQRSGSALTTNAVSLQSALVDPLSASPEQIVALQRTYGNRAVQRLIQRAEAEKTQRDSAVGLEGGAVDGDLQNQIQSVRGGGQPLDKTVGSKIGGALGADFSGVRVHTDSKSDTLNRSLSAKAFTLGSDVFFSKGAYNPGTHSGQQLLAHELTHVVQQGAVSPHGQRKVNKVQTKLTVGPAGDKYEQEAERVAGQVMQMATPAVGDGHLYAETQTQRQVAPTATPNIQRTGHPVIQRVVYQEIIDRFKRGDLMYGLSFSRSDTQPGVKAKMRALDTTGGDAQQAASVLDELNNYFVGTSGYTETDVAKYGVAYGTQKTGYKPSPEVSKQALAFKDWLETDPAFKDIFTGVTQARDVAITDRLRTWERIKQVCKAGLYYTTKIQKNQIFFILDNLNIPDVVNKWLYNKDDNPEFDPTKSVHDPTGDSREDITSAEIRFLYRNRNDKTIMDRVSFWRGGAEVPAPWIERPAIWQKYENQRNNVADDTPKKKTKPDTPQGPVEEINAVRDRVLGKLANRKWPYAAMDAVDLNLTYEKTGFFSQGSLFKKIMGLGALSDIREEAKNIDPKMKDPERLDKIADIASRARTAANPAGKKHFKDNMLLVVQKIAFYLIRLLPKEDLKKGVIYQAQRGVTGISKRSASPTAILMMGIAGSGKSTVLRRLVKNQQDWVRADPDAVKEALPEYKEGVARGDTTIATKVHDESKDINKAIAARAIKHHRNLIYDATGNDKTDYVSLIQSLKQTDYRIRLVLVHTPVNIALARVKQRALETGRDVPEKVVKHQATRVPKHFEELSTQVDEAFIYSGAGAMGNRPVVEWKLGHGAKPTEKIKDLDKRGG